MEDRGTSKGPKGRNPLFGAQERAVMEKRAEQREGKGWMTQAPEAERDGAAVESLKEPSMQEAQPDLCLFSLVLLPTRGLPRMFPLFSSLGGNKQVLSILVTEIYQKKEPDLGARSRRMA